MSSICQVATAWLKAAPCEALSEALRRVWEQSVVSFLALDQTNNNDKDNNLGHGGGVGLVVGAGRDRGPSRGEARLTVRRMLLECLCDVLDWRLVQSRPAAATADLLLYRPIGHHSRTLSTFYLSPSICLSPFS